MNFFHWFKSREQGVVRLNTESVKGHRFNFIELVHARIMPQEDFLKKFGIRIIPFFDRYVYLIGNLADGEPRVASSVRQDKSDGSNWLGRATRLFAAIYSLRL